MSLSVQSPYQPKMFQNLQERAGGGAYHAKVQLEGLLDASAPGWSGVGSTFVVGSYADAENNRLRTFIQRKESVRAVSLWRQHVFSKAASADVDSISETISYVFQAISEVGPLSIDLSKVDANTVNAEHLVAVLRATFSSRNEITGWNHALQIAQVALRNANLPPEQILAELC